MIQKVEMAVEQTGMAKAQRIECIRPVMARYKLAFSQPNPPRATLRDEVYGKLQQFGLAEHGVTVPVTKIGTFPRNRSNTMLDEHNLDGKLIGLHTGGLSLGELSRAAAVERPRGEKGHQWEQKCANLAKLSRGKIAEVSPESLTCFTTCVNHTKESLRCIAFGTCSTVDAVSQDGRVSRERFEHRGDAFKEALDKGIKLLMIAAEVEDAFPWLIDELMEADNISNQIASKDNDVALLRKINREAQKLAADGTVIEPEAFWNHVIKRVQGSELSRAGSISDYVAFVRHCVGGVDNPVVLDFLGAIAGAGLSTVTNTIKPHMFKFLSTLDLGPGVNPMYFTLGAVLAAQHLTADADGASNTPTKTDIVSLVKNKPIVSTCTAIQTAAHEFVDTIKSTVVLTEQENAVVMTELAQLHIRLFAHNTRTKGSHLGKYGGMVEIGNLFYDKITTAVAIPEDVVRPTVLAPKVKVVAKNAATAVAVPKVAAPHSVDEWFKKRGVLVGKDYKQLHKDPNHEGAMFTLKRIDPKGTHVMLESEGKKIKVDKDTFFANYKASTDKLKRKGADHDYTVPIDEIARIAAGMIKTFSDIEYIEAAPKMNGLISVVEEPLRLRKVTAVKELRPGDLAIPIEFATVKLAREVTESNCVLGVIELEGTEYKVTGVALPKSVFACVKAAPAGNSKIDYVAYKHDKPEQMKGTYWIPRIVNTKVVKAGDEIVLAQQSAATKKLRTK